MRVALLCIGMLGLLKFLLAMNVSRLRRKTRTSAGHSDDPADPLYRAVVAHSNAAEFTPMLCVLMLSLEMIGSANWVIWVFGAAVAARFCHAIGILNYPLRGPNIFRVLGAAGTYTCGLLMSGFLVYWAFSNQR